MATSGNNVYTVTTQQIVKDAFVEAGIYRQNQALPTEDYNAGLRKLNTLAKSWQAMGYNIWNDKRATLFLQYGTAKYTLSSTGDHATESFVETALTNDEVAGATQLEIDSTTGVSVDDYAGIVLDDGTITWSTISGLGQITSYDEDFSSDTGFTYDNTLTEFSGGQTQQLSQRPANAIFGATYTTTINGSWADGSITGTGTGSPVITGNQLDLSGATLKYVDYNGTSNTSIQIGTIKFKLTPNYSGTPAGNQTIYSESNAVSGTLNQISINHVFVTGDMIVIIRDSAGVIIFSATLAVWNPTASTTYEFELDFDITTGASRLFIDGTQLGATQVATGTRDNNIGLIRIGSTPGAVSSPDFFMEDLVRFDAVQHVANYVAGYTLDETDYVEDLISLPDQTGLNITEYISFITSQTSNGVWNINGYYWNGTAWVNSDNSYAQMNTAAVINTNIASLSLNGQILIKLRMEASNIQSKVDNMEITYADNTVTTVRISLTSGLPSAASSGNVVFIYTTKVSKPLEVKEVMLHQSDNNEVELPRIEREKYFGLSDKSAIGSPNQYYYQRNRLDGYMYLWSTPSDVTQYINFTYQPYLDNFETAGNEPDFPIEWERAIVLNLASELSCAYGVGMETYNKVVASAKYWLDIAKGNDNESGKLTFDMSDVW